MINKPRVLLIGNFLSDHIGTRGVCEDLSEHLAGIGVLVRMTSFRMGRFARILDMVSTILAQRPNYDLVYLEVYSGLAFVWAEVCARLLSALRKPFVLALHGGGLPDFAENNAKRLATLLSSADAVATPSLFIQAHLSSIRSGIRYIPNALDIARYPFHQRERLAPKLIWMRAFHEIYHPEMAVLSLAEIVHVFPNATLTMIGPDKRDGSMKKTQSLITSLNLDEKVTISGPVKKMNVPSELQVGDIFLNTTRFESFGVSVLEAAACGLPVVTTNVGELSYLWKDGENALLVAPDDFSMMTRAIERLLVEKNLAAFLSKNARQKAEQFDWAVTLPQWEILFSEVLGG